MHVRSEKMLMFLPYADIPCFVELHFIEFHRGCVVCNLKARPSTSEKVYDPLNCGSHFIAVVWN